jgi:HEPN domain-containing protein
MQCAKDACSMRPDTAEWVKKTEADFFSMTREMNTAKDFNYDLVCFLAQQSVEKYLKALLCESSVPFPKVHDLNKLAALLPEHFDYPESFRAPISRLDRYAIEFRYPGASATRELAAEAVEDAAAFRDWCRKA